MIINSANLNKIRTGFKSLYDSAFGQVNTDWQKLAMIVNSSSADMKYGWLGKTTKFREWIGDRVYQNLKSHDFAIKNKDFENTVGVDRNDIQDDILGQYSVLFSQLGQDAGNHPAELLYGLIKSGTTSLCYDGQYFFDTDHPVMDGNGVTQSISNFGGGGGNAWYLFDTTKVVKPFIFQKREDYKFVALDNPDDQNVFSKKEYVYGVDARCNVGFGLWQLAYASKQALTAANYSTARGGMMAVQSDNGQPLGIVPNLMVVGPSNEAAAREIAQAERNAAGATNVWRGTVEVLVVPWLP